MTVYVDPLGDYGWVIGGRFVRSCHLFTDGSLEELDALATQIGLLGRWRQLPSTKGTGVMHYDLTATKRERAICAGAWPVTRRKAVEIWRGGRCVSS